MGPPKLDIQFQSPGGVFYPGSELRGKILVTVTGRKEKVRGLRIWFKGWCRVQFGSKQAEKFDCFNYCSDEEYFKYSFDYFCGNNDLVEILPGTHTYPFRYDIPAGIPTSVETPQGYVRYHVRATLQRTSGDSVELVKNFTVNNPLDLNTAESSLSQPLELTANRTVLGLLCCPRGKATMKARISKRGFVCGERLPITVEIVNGTTKTVGDTSVTLERIVECIGCHIAKGDSKMESSVESVRVATVGAMPPGRDGIYELSSFRIPPMPPSKLDGCQFINVKYELKLTAPMESSAKALVLSLPLIIGSVPRREAFSSFSSAPSTPVDPQPSAPPLIHDITPLLSVYPDLPPPSYEESVSPPEPYQRDVSDVDGKSEFQPKYLIYTTSNM